MWNFLKIAVLSLVLISAVRAEDIANCESPSGQAFFPHKGLVNKKDSGWQADKISGGKFTLTKNSQLQYDLLFVDSTKRITSTVADGGKIVPMRRNADDAAFIIAYSDAIEIYNFWKTADGKLQFSMLQNRGSGAVVSKSSVLIGQCDFIKFDSIN
jgi:hypothetical protein